MARTPAEYYSLARQFLRGSPGGAAPPAVPAPDYWLPPATNRAATAPTKPPNGKRGSFRDQFRNALIEVLWKKHVGTWVENTAGYMGLTIVSSSVVPKAQLLTWNTDYGSVDCSLNVLQKATSGANRLVYIMANASAIDPDPLTCYLWLHDMQTGSWELDRFDTGSGTALAFGNIGATTAPLSMRFVNNAGTLTGYINGVDLTGPVVDGTPLPAGRVGLACSVASFRFDDWQCTKL